jgi:hypothetical protein
MHGALCFGAILMSVVAFLGLAYRRGSARAYCSIGVPVQLIESKEMAGFDGRPEPKSRAAGQSARHDFR